MLKLATDVSIYVILVFFTLTSVWCAPQSPNLNQSTSRVTFDENIVRGWNVILFDHGKDAKLIKIVARIPRWGTFMQPAITPEELMRIDMVFVTDQGEHSGRTWIQKSGETWGSWDDPTSVDDYAPRPWFALDSLRVTAAEAVDIALRFKTEEELPFWGITITSSYSPGFRQSHFPEYEISFVGDQRLKVSAVTGQVVGTNDLGANVTYTEY